MSGNSADRPKQRGDVTASRPNPAQKWICGYAAEGLQCSLGPDARGVCCQTADKTNNGRDSARVTDGTASQRDFSSRASDAQKPTADCEAACACSEVCELAELRAAPRLPSHEQLGPCIPVCANWFSRQTFALNLAVLIGGSVLLCMAIPQRESLFAPGGLSKKHSQILGNRLVSERCSQCHPHSHAFDTQVGSLIEWATGNGGLESDASSEAVEQDELCLTCHASHMPDARLQLAHDLTLEQLARIQQSAASPGQWQNTNLRANSPTRCAMCHVEHHGQSFDLTAISDASCQACHQRRFESLAVGHPEFVEYPYRAERRIAFDHAAHEQKHFPTKSANFDCATCHVSSTDRSAVGTIFRSVDFDRACANCHAEPIRAATIVGWAVLQLPSLDSADLQRFQSTGAETSSSFPDLLGWPAGARFGYEGEISAAAQWLIAGDPQAMQALEKLPASAKLQDIPLHSRDRAAVSLSLARGFKKLIFEVAERGQLAWSQRLQQSAEQRLGRKLEPREMQLVEQLSAGIPPDLFRDMRTSWFSPGELTAGSTGLSELRMVESSSSTKQFGAPNQTTNGLLDDDLLGSSFLDDSSLDGNLLDASNAPKQRSKPTKLTSLRGAMHVAAGGWYLDPERLALMYMPRGHSDLTLAAWTQFVALLNGVTGARDDSSQGKVAAGGVSHSSGVPGSCAQCHLLDGSPQPFRSWSRPGSVKPFTRFSHTPHLTLPALRDCRYCHQLNTETSKGAEFGFMKAEQCTACHRPGGANDGCTQCHNYHVDQSGLSWSQPAWTSPPKSADKVH